MVTPPILDNKHTSMPSVFAPAALLREARRQKGLDAVAVPPVCILDPDGDLVRRDAHLAEPSGQHSHEGEDADFGAHLQPDGDPDQRRGAHVAQVG